MSISTTDDQYFPVGRNINGYYAFHFFFNLIFWLPIYAIFFLTKNLDFASILILFALSKTSQTLLEIPSGVLADRWGRRPVLMLGSFLHSAGYLCIAFGADMYWYLGGMILHGAGYAFVSGTDSALLYDSLAAAGREEEFKQIEGRAYMYNLSAAGAGGLVGGILATQDLILPYIASAISAFLACLVIATCLEPPRHKRGVTFSRFLGSAAEVIKGNRSIRAAILFSALTFGLLLVCHKFSQPYLQRAEIDIEYFGVIYFVWLIFAALSSNFSNAIEQRIGYRFYFLSLPILTGAVVVYLGLYQNWGGAALVLLYQFVWGSLRPQINHIINRETASSMRATILSTAGFGSSIVYIIFGPLFGLAADQFDFTVALLYLGIAILVLGLGAAVYIIRHHPERSRSG
ncbi:MAG: MFS transporter [FCB group bacterium]|nr:MFS transporter [FCB group bacterium]